MAKIAAKVPARTKDANLTKRYVTPEPVAPKLASQVVATIATYDPDLERQFEEDAGLGISTDARDNIVPNIRVLQPLSPEVVQGEIKDARAGDLLLRGVSPTLVSGNEGVMFQPCGMTEAWFEFVPREQGGGFVARYNVALDDGGNPIPPAGAFPEDGNPFKFTFSELGHTCVHYRFVPGIVWQDGVGLEFVLQFYGTGHSVARAWNTEWLRKRNAKGVNLPAYSHLYHITTVQMSNKKGTWFALEFDKGCRIDSAEAKPYLGDYNRAKDQGRSLALAFAKGEKISAADVSDSSAEYETPSRMPDDEVPF